MLSITKIVIIQIPTVMESLKDKAKNFKQTTEEVKKWQEIRQNLFKPEITDTSVIPMIYEWVKEICTQNESINTFKYDTKHYFLVCIIFLYSPRVMVEENMNEGIRDVVAEVLKISPFHVSNSCATVRDWFFIYRDFEESLTYLYSEILNRIDLYGLK